MLGPLYENYLRKIHEKKIIVLLLLFSLFSFEEKFEALTISRHQKEEPFSGSGFESFEGTGFSEDGFEGTAEPGYTEFDVMDGDIIRLVKYQVYLVIVNTAYI